MQLLESFRHFLFPFDQDILETPTVVEEQTQQSDEIVQSLPNKTQESHEFIVSDSFLYLNNL